MKMSTDQRICARGQGVDAGVARWPGGGGAILKRGCAAMPRAVGSSGYTGLDLGDGRLNTQVACLVHVPHVRNVPLVLLDIWSLGRMPCVRTRRAAAIDNGQRPE